MFPSSPKTTLVRAPENVSWEEYEAAKHTEESGANERAGVYFLADRFPDPDRAGRASTSSPAPTPASWSSRSGP